MAISVLAGVQLIGAVILRVIGRPVDPSQYLSGRLEVLVVVDDKLTVRTRMQCGQQDRLATGAGVKLVVPNRAIYIVLRQILLLKPNQYEYAGTDILDRFRPPWQRFPLHGKGTACFHALVVLKYNIL